VIPIRPAPKPQPTVCVCVCVCGCRPEAAVSQSLFVVCRLWLHRLLGRHATGCSVTPVC